VGLFSYKKMIHPVGTTRRATMRSVTPKPARKVRRAALTVRHPGSSLEGTAKASLSRSVSRSGTRRRSQSNSGAFVAVLTVLVYVAVAAAILLWLLLKLCWLLIVWIINSISKRQASTSKQLVVSASPARRSSREVPTATVTGEHYEQLLGPHPE